MRVFREERVAGRCGISAKTRDAAERFHVTAFGGFSGPPDCVASLDRPTRPACAPLVAKEPEKPSNRFLFGEVGIMYLVTPFLTGLGD